MKMLMEMELSTFWWVLAAVTLIVEMLSGTVYLLLISAGFVAAALSAGVNVGLPLQIVVAAALSVALVGAWWRLRSKARLAAVSPEANGDLNMDIGQTVQVDVWANDGTASVMHRGARWSVTPEAGCPKPYMPGAYRIVAVVGSQFVVAPLTAG